MSELRTCNHKIAIAQDGEHKGLYHCTACHLLVSPYSVAAKFTEIKCLKNEIALGDEEISELNTRIAELEAQLKKCDLKWVKVIDKLAAKIGEVCTSDQKEALIDSLKSPTEQE